MDIRISGTEIKGAIRPGYEDILTAEALHFIEQLERQFGERRRELLDKQEKKAKEN